MGHYFESSNDDDPGYTNDMKTQRIRRAHSTHSNLCPSIFPAAQTSARWRKRTKLECRIVFATVQLLQHTKDAFRPFEILALEMETQKLVERRDA